MINGSPYIKFKDPYAKLSQPGDINLRNVYENFNIKLKDSNGGMSGFIQNHPYLRDTVHGAVSGATMLLNNQSQHQMKQAQRDYLNNPFNLYQTTATKKYGSRPWLDSTAQFTDFPNEKVPVFEPGYQNSAYLNPMAKAKQGGQLYMTFQGGGATNQLGAGSSLPKYEMGSGSPVQQALLRDSQHYGLPIAEQGGFFTPEKLSGGTENEELYNKPNNFLNYLRDMSANTVVQNALGRRRKGQLSDEEEMGMAQMGMPAPAPQQGANQQEQLIQMVAQALQQGASPEEVMQKLVEMGLPENEAQQLVQMVAEQLEGSNQEAPSEEMPQESQEQAPQGMEQQMAQGMQQQMPMAQLGMGGGGGDFEEFGFNNQNPLNPYYQNLYDPSEAKQVNASLVEGLYDAGSNVLSQPMGYFKGKQAEAQAKLDQLQKYFTTPQAELGGSMTRYQKKAIVKPTATDAAGFEKWYNETMGNLLSDPNTTQAEIDSFMQMAGNWASDIKVDRNQLQSTAQNPLTFTTQIPHKNSPGYATVTRQRMTRDNGDKYQQEYLDILKKFDTDYEVAAANNQIASSKNPNADPMVLRNLEAARDKALQDLEKKYPTKVATDQDFFYSKPGAAPTTTTTTTPGTTTTTGPGGYQFNPAMQKMLQLMAQGYTKAPLFGFRTNRNINALFNQTMADMMLKGQGQGQGTASAAGTTIPGAPAVGPDGAYNTWIKDNNITDYKIIPGRHGVKMKIRANQPGKGLAQVDANGNLINTGNGGPGGPGFFRNVFGNKYNQSKFNVNQTDPDTKVDYTRLQSTIDPEKYSQYEALLNPNRANRVTNRMQRVGDKIDRMYQYHNMMNDIDNKYDKPPVEYTFTNREQNRINRLTNRYNDLAGEHGREEYTKPKMPTKAYGGSYAYGGAYAAGGQYKEGGTYYLSDEEIQALIDAGYELE